MSDRDLDAEFARIIAGWDDEAPDPQGHADGGGPADDAAVAFGPARADGAPEVDTVEDRGRTRKVDESPEPGGTAPSPTTPASPEPTDEPGGQGTTGSPTQTNQPSSSNQPNPSGSSGPSGPSTPTGSSGLLELPIAPTTPHAWRGSTPPRDDAGDVVDDDDHFVPPSEIDLPSAETDPMFWAIVGGLVGGPLLLLYVLFFDRDGSGWWVVTALAMVVVGFVLLVLRGGTERDPFDDGTRL